MVDNTLRAKRSCSGRCYITPSDIDNARFSAYKEVKLMESNPPSFVEHLVIRPGFKMKLSASFASLLAIVSFAAAQSQVWGQCQYTSRILLKPLLTESSTGGGQGWTGPTTCVAGSVCVAQNQWYSQCLPAVRVLPLPCNQS